MERTSATMEDHNSYLTKPGMVVADMVNFADTDHCTALVDKLNTQREFGKLCDVVFSLQSNEYMAHRSVLAACSPYFESVFKMHKAIRERLEVTGQSKEAFEAFLSYVYTGKITITRSSVGELLKWANQYAMTKLKEHCGKFLEMTLTVGNCFNVKELADRGSLPALMKTTEAFIMANITIIMQQVEIQQFAEQKIQAFLLNKTFPLSEDMKLRLVCHWVRLCPEIRHPAMPRLLSIIQWSRVGVQALYDIIRSDSLFADSEWCVLHMLEKFQENGMLYPMYQQVLVQLKAKLAPGKEADQISAIPETDISLQGEQETLPENTDNMSSTEAENMVENDKQADAGQEKSSTEVDETTLVKAPRKTYDAAKSQQTHRRKGRPVKLNISKDSISMCIKLPAKQPRKRGRPRSRWYHRALKPTSKAGSQQEDNKKPNLKMSRRNLKRKRKKPKSFSDSESDVRTDEEGKHLRTKKSTSYSPDAGTVTDSAEGIDEPSGSKHSRRKMIPKVNCPHCTFIANGQEKLDLHIERIHQDEVIFECCMCDYNSSWNRDYYKHMKTHFPGPPFKCDFEACDYVGERIQAMLTHRLIHTDSRPHVCDICQQGFRTRNNLTSHYRLHTGEKPFVCLICQRGFATKGTLDQHSVTHSDVRPYLCDTCGFSTKYQSHLIAHRRIHTGDVFHCQYQNCTYKTPKRSQLACHMRSHMSIRTHICSTCGRGFVEKSHLVRHEKIHLDEHPYKCNQCNYSSTRRDKLKEHETKYHTADSTPRLPYKPRRPRRQTFKPECFPGADNAKTEMEFQSHMQAAIAQHTQMFATQRESCDQSQDFRSVSTSYPAIDQSEETPQVTTLQTTSEQPTIEGTQPENSTVDGQAIGLTQGVAPLQLALPVQQVISSSQLTTMTLQPQIPALIPVVSSQPQDQQTELGNLHATFMNILN